ncbi:uncharacterized protein BO80DRAFT_424997, partial [Aspergillus ibericus CBS 121593]
MQFLFLLTTALSLGAGSLASPAPAPQSLDPRAYYWHGCAAGIECHSDADCRSSSDCIQTAQSNTNNIHCGQENYPFACWAEGN